MRYRYLPYMKAVYLTGFTFYISYGDNTYSRRKNNRIVNRLKKQHKKDKYVARQR